MNTSLIARQDRLSARLLALVSALLVAAVSVLTPSAIPVARAASFTVACGDRAGLIAAITSANTNGEADTIDLAAGCTYTLTTANTGGAGDESGLPVIQPDGGNALTINGNGATIIRSAAAPNFRLFAVASNANLILNDMSLQNGASGSAGGGLLVNGTATINRSTINNNTSPSGGGLYVNGTATFNSTTISNNRAVANDGGGLFVNGTATILNSTISGNSAIGFGGGLVTGSGASAVVTISFATIAGNSALNGGGVSRFSSGNVSIKNSIIALQSGGADCSGTISAAGTNFSTDGSCTALTSGFTTVTPAALKLGPLANNGGPTQTQAPLNTSVAIDAATDCTAFSESALTVDQRGKARPAGAACDVGAVERSEQIVSTTADSGSGSLRQAILDANGASGKDTIVFSIPGSGVHTITPASPLPPLSGPVVIDGLTQSGAGCAAWPPTLLVELDGSAAGGTGLSFQGGASGSTVRGLVINRFATGIGLTSASNNTITCNVIGSDATGMLARPNTGAGIDIKESSSTNIIGGPGSNDRNLIATNGGSGVNVQSGTGNTIRGNVIFANRGGGITLATGANNNQVSPTITAAVPNNASSNIQGWMIAAPDTTYTVDLFLNTSCDPSGVGQGQALLLSLPATTDANGAFPLTTDLEGALPAGQFVTATATDPAGNTSAFSSCTFVGPDNDAWYAAYDLNPQPTASFNQPVALPGQTRWYKFHVQPRSQVTVNLSNLPREYDMALFSDIGASASDLTDGQPNTQSLAIQQTQLDYDALEASNFVTNTLDPQFISPEAYSAQALSPGTFSPSVIAPYAVSPFKTSPFKTSPFKTSPFKTSPFKTSPFKTSPFKTSPFKTSPFKTSTYTTAETEAGVAIDNNLLSLTDIAGTTPRSLVLNTWDQGGTYYVAVYGRNGSYDPARTFALQVTETDTACSSIVTPAPSGALLQGVGGTYQTIILNDPNRIPGSQADKSALAQRLATFAARPDVRGVVVDVSQDGLVRAANQQADANSACPNAKNIVAQAVKDVVNRYRSANANLAYVVIVGGDATIPFFRYPDQALLGNETTFEPPVNGASNASLRLGYILGQDAYGSSVDIPFKTTVLPVPQLAVGRLVETATEAKTAIDAYIATGGLITPTTSLVSGYDFHYDSSKLMAGEFSLGTGRAADTLLSPSTQSNQAPGTWTANDLRDKLFSSRHDLLYLAGHFSDSALLAADYTTSLPASEILASTVPLTGSLVISPGCHSGYNTVDGDAVSGVTQQPDWAQTFARKGATLIGGTGYQYGDTEFVQFAEELYVYLAQQLRVGNGPVAIGPALADAKQRYLLNSAKLRGIDLKTLAIASVYGLPMMRVNMPGARLQLPSDASIIASGSLATVAGNPYGLQTADTSLTASLTERTINLAQTTGGAMRAATYISGTNGIVANPAEPVLPLEQRNVAVASTLLRGVGFRGGSYTDLLNRLPLTGAPATELRGVHVTFPTEAFYPTKFWAANYYGTISNPAAGITRLSVTPTQFLANSSTSDTGTLREYGQTQYRLFYNNNTATVASGAIPALAGPPTIAQVTSSASSNTITFKVGAFGESSVGAQAVWVTYTGTSGPLYGQWQSLDLTRSPSDDLAWQGTLTLPTGASSDQVRFIVQAVNQVGIVALDTNQGAYFVVGVDPGQASPPPASATTLALQASPANLGYGATTTLRATLQTGNTPLAGQTIAFSIDTLARQATTDASGVATVSLPLQVDPSQYTAYATYTGSLVYQSASATTPISILKANSTLILSPLPATVGTGVVSSVVATLKDATGVPIVDETVALIVKGSNGTYSSVLKTDVAGRAPLGLIPLPVGSYTVSAYFGGAIPAPVSVTYVSTAYNPATPQSGTLTIVAASDTMPPLTSIGSVPPDPSANALATFTFSGSDNLTPAANLTFECSLDGSAYVVCVSPMSYNGLSNSVHTFQVRAKDAAGNRDATPAFHRWTVNAPSAPDTTITAGPPNPSMSTTASFSFTGSVAGASSNQLTFECLLDNGGWGTCASPITYTGLSASSHTFQVRAVDSAGRRDPSPASYTWEVKATCAGKIPTIYVDASGVIRGGPDNGKRYKGTLKGGNGDDVIVGTSGNDKIDGGNGNDTICGGTGNDTIDGGNGNDIINGGAGNDTIKGGNGNDTLDGGLDDDKLSGENGNDTLIGGLGKDFFSGGSGSDTNTDFNPAQGDTKDNT